MSKGKDKEIIFKGARKKQLVAHKRTFLRLSVAFSLECFSSKAVALYTQSAERKTSQPTVVCLGKLSFRIEGMIGSFPEKRIWWFYTRLTLQQMLKALFQAETKGH